MATGFIAAMTVSQLLSAWVLDCLGRITSYNVCYTKLLRAAPVGADLRHEYTIVGDVVNLSARLAQVCEAGQVFTDSNTAVRVSEHIDFTPLPPVKLKGKQDAIIPYCVKGERIKARRLQDYFGTWDKPP